MRVTIDQLLAENIPELQLAARIAGTSRLAQPVKQLIHSRPPTLEIVDRKHVQHVNEGQLYKLGQALGYVKRVTFDHILEYSNVCQPEACRQE